MTKKTINLYLGLVIIYRFGIYFFMATYALFLASHGLNRFQMNLVNTVFYATMLLSEIPTGAIADVFGRKKAYISACILRAAGFLVYAFSGSFFWFAIGEALTAIGTTFENGAFQAWLVDRLNHFEHDGEKLHKILARAERFGMIAGAVSAIIGAKVGAINLAFPWFLSAGAMLACGVLAYFKMKEEYFKPKKYSLVQNLENIKATIGQGIVFAIKSKAILFLFLIGLFQFISIQAPNMQWPLYMRQYFGSDTSLGYIAAAISITVAVGSGIAPKFLARVVSEKRAIAIVQVLMGLTLFATALVGQVFVVIPAFMIHELTRGIFKPIKDAYLHDNITDIKKRATVSSFDSMARHIGGIIGLVLSGLLAQKSSIPVTWIVSGLFLSLSTIFVAKFSKE